MFNVIKRLNLKTKILGLAIVSLLVAIGVICGVVSTMNFRGEALAQPYVGIPEVENGYLVSEIDGINVENNQIIISDNDDIDKLGEVNEGSDVVLKTLDNSKDVMGSLGTIATVVKNKKLQSVAAPVNEICY